MRASATSSSLRLQYQRASTVALPATPLLFLDWDGDGKTDSSSTTAEISPSTFPPAPPFPVLIATIDSIHVALTFPSIRTATTGRPHQAQWHLGHQLLDPHQQRQRPSLRHEHSGSAVERDRWIRRQLLAGLRLDRVEQLRQGRRDQLSAAGIRPAHRRGQVDELRTASAARTTRPTTTSVRASMASAANSSASSASMRSTAATVSSLALTSSRHSRSPGW